LEATDIGADYPPKGGGVTGVDTSAAPRVAYLVNLYPSVSHTFIRREILALERQGVAVQRIAVRGWNGVLVDPEDVREQSKTQYVLRRGIIGIVTLMLMTFLRSPIRFASALSLAVRMGWRAFRPIPYHVVYLAQACQILSWVKASGATHVHAHFGTNPAELAMLVHALGGPRYSFTIHGPEEFDKPDLHKLTAKILDASFVVAISSFCRSQIFRWIPQDHWPKVKVVHCGLEPAFHSTRLTPPPTAPRLVCVGRLCEQKGQLLLVEAAARVLRKGLPLELVLAGDGEMRQEIERLVASLGIGEYVRITGWVSSSEVRELMLASRALVLPSFAEGLPVVIMEAMALGRPVLTTFVGGIPELVRGGEEGWLFPAGDVEAIATAIESGLRATVEELGSMGQRARARALLRHDVDTESAKLLKLFSTITAQPARTH
jgi:colanic acid/amylovoran biosynthesis glycosyltransferase